MKRIIAVATFIAPLLAAGPSVAGEQTVTLSVDNMYCAACPFTVRQSLAAVPGVSQVQVSYEKKSAVVTFDDAKTTLDTITAASKNAGYPSRLARAGG